MITPNSTICGDCLELLPAISSGSIDLILSDLPYGITQNKWDFVIPLDKLFSQLWRVIRKNRAIVLTSSQPFASLLVYQNIEKFKYEWIWRKNCVTGHLNVKRMPMKEHESILVFSEDSHLYNPQGLMPYNKIKKRGHNGLNYGVSGSENFQEVTNYPRSILEFPCSRDKQHPTQKPVELFKYLIETYSNKGDLVLDVCCGSGTTGVACLETERRFIQFDISPEYCDIARSRIL